MNPYNFALLFEPFHTTKGDKGTGLGLYITKQLVERNGGKITAHTKEGGGTTFVLEFRITK
ncbi:MAG: HAMP domain-containing histidine kinase [Candidatus Omnitrophica bacterium]|nr:HAMP domain-containing histidine kinase [Candidatus Omnitrophota bacterium]